VTNRLLVDVTDDGHVSVSAWPSSDLYPQPAGPPAQLVWPLDDEALAELRWYLEDYLRAPYGVYQERGARAAGRLPGWGEEIFSSLFARPGTAWDAYRRVCDRERPKEIVVRSSSPRWLGLPWELLRDPQRPNPVVLDGVGLSRSLPTAGLADAFAVSGQRLRVLMVISRPDGPADVDYRMVARPLQERLEAVRGSVELVVLRPPTLDQLRKALAAARQAEQPFQIVHFDGHGAVSTGSGWGPAVTLAGGLEPEAVLAFEKPGGGADLVPAGTVARVLAEAQVPVVVLNACQSGAVGKELEATVATRLLQEGAACVVAMAYTVYAVAAAEFMAEFYERLFAGDRVTEAVAAGRRRMAEKNLRPSPPGRRPLADWLVPVQYARGEVTFPGLRTERPAGMPSLALLLDRAGDPAGDQEDPLTPVDPFVGRDALFYLLEKAARLQHVVLLHGPGGAGKTELAKAFGRWWRDTGGVGYPDGVIWHSFEPGVASFGLDGVITEIGMRIFGADFARLDDPAKRQAAVLKLLNSRRLLLIWDNVESIHTMPDPSGVTPPLDEPEQEELRRFTARVAAGGSSVILLTSRSNEQWLGAIRRIEVPGLTRQEAAEYADHLLAPFPQAAPRRKEPEFADLMDWLDGHPLSLRLVLPHLDTTGPMALLHGLRGAVDDLPGDIAGGGRTSSLSASITYSYDHLPADARRLLVALSLFQGVADADVLGIFSGAPQVSARFAGRTTEDWKQLLDHSVRVGLVSPLGAGMYWIHPALPGYLAARWRREDPDRYAEQRDAAEQALLHACATFGAWLDQQIGGGDARLAFALLHHQRRTFGALLGRALDHQLWEHAQAIIQPLDEYWNASGLYEQARRWVDRIRLALEGPDGAPPAPDTLAGSLWLFVVMSQANREVKAHKLESAERAYLEVRDMLDRQPASTQRQGGLAAVYHQLGMVAHERGWLDDAEGWYRRSLTIEQELGNRPGVAASYHQLGRIAQLRTELDSAENWYRRSLTIAQELGDRLAMATSYHQLGVVAQLRGERDDAEEWYRQSLTIKQELGDRHGMATSYHQLGVVAQLRGQLDDAEEWYRQSLTIKQELGDRHGMTSSYHQLGVVAQLRGQLDDAEEWYRQSLTIMLELGNRPRVAGSYHQLGRVAQLRGQLDDAENWYRQSLTIRQELGDRPGMADSFGQLGLLAGQRGQAVEALTWTVRCVALFEEFPHPASDPGPTLLARLTATLGVEALEQCWQEVTGHPLPQAVRDYVEGGGDQ
jgi:tetratricopeptide (TPR) repeat protein